jgi:hypothetical protein
VWEILFEHGERRTTGGDLASYSYNSFDQVAELIMVMVKNKGLADKERVLFLELIFKYGSQVTDQTLRDAIEHQCEPGVLRLLLKHRIRKSGKLRGSWTLILAASLENEGLCKILIEEGFDVNAWPRLETDMAWNDPFERVDTMRSGVDIMSPLHAAVESMSLWAVKFFLENGARVNIKDGRVKRRSGERRIESGRTKKRF